MKQGFDSEVSAACGTEGDVNALQQYAIDETSVSVLAPIRDLATIRTRHLAQPYAKELVAPVCESWRAASDGGKMMPATAQLLPLWLIVDPCDMKAVSPTLGLTGSEKNGKG